MKSNKSKKIFFHEIAFLTVFPVQKLIFGYFLNCKKWNLVKKNIHEIDLFDFTSFLAWISLNFPAHYALYTTYIHDSAYFQCLQAEIFGQRFFSCQVVGRKPQLRIREILGKLF